MAMKNFVVQLGLLLCKGIVVVYDVVTLVLYCVTDQPWKYWKQKRIVWSKRENENDPYSPYVRERYRCGPPRQGIDTLNQLFESVVERYRSNPCYGTRTILDEEEITDQSGRVIKKLSLGDYKWMTYKEADMRIEEIRRGLLSIGIRPRKPIVILAETKVEWILTAQACFRINTPIVTLYATLGEAGLIHGINETEITHIITSSALLTKLKRIINQTPLITHLVYMESSLQSGLDGFPDSLKVISLSELIEGGKSYSDYICEPPASEDLAILMYTSGSTGIPKGVVLSHKNLVSTAVGIGDTFPPSVLATRDNYNMYVAYLPLAHIFELVIEIYFSSIGIPVGFSSPHTLTDSSPAVKTGFQGDLRVLKPTIMATVPLVLDRLRTTILTSVEQKGTFSRGIFEFAIKYKIFWMYQGFKTRMLDRFLLKKCSAHMGGKLHLLICAGAPVSPDTQNFTRACLCTRVIQGYGMTETAGSATAADVDEISTGRVGSPLSTVKIRLVDWKEGGYRATDVPRPRGEIVVGGSGVARGYYKRDDLTNECFRREHGISWFYSGDIGEVFPNGTFKVIDRKKDLVKLQFGEYVALGKIEAQLKTYPLIDNICVIGNGMYNYLVALVVPNQNQLSILAKEIGKSKMNLAEMCCDCELEAAATSRIREYGKKDGLQPFELPVKIKLCSEEWVPENGLVTAALKLRRKQVQHCYKQIIEDMFLSKTQNKNAKGKC